MLSSDSTVREFFTELFAAPISGFLEIRSCAKGKCSQSFHPLPLTGLPCLPSKTHDVYFGVAPRRQRRGTSDAVRETSTLWADVDAKVFAGRKDEALRMLQDFGPLTPSIIVDSGHGYHAYWLLAEAAAISEARPVMEALRCAINPALDRVDDPPRVLRVPSTFNHKNGEMLPVRIVHWEPQRRSGIEAFKELLDLDEASEQLKRRGQRAALGASVHEGNGSNIERIKRGVDEGERNDAASRLAGHYLAKGLSADETLDLLGVWNAKNNSPLIVDELRSVVLSIARRELLKRGEALGDCEDRETVLQAVSECFHIDITDIVRIGGSEPTYRIYACERMVELSAGDLESQSKFRKAIIAVAERVPHRIGPKAKPGWDHWLQLMLDAARPVEPGEEATQRGQLKLWLGRYLEDREAKPHGEEIEEAGDPFLHDGQIYVSLDQFHRFVDTEFGEKIDQKRLAQMLSAEGSNSGDFQVNIVGGERRHRHMWPVPASLYDPKSRPT